jgi:hypothetical protein
VRFRLILVIAMAGLATTLVAGSALAVVGPTPIKTGIRNQWSASGNASYFAWTQDAAGDRRARNVWVKPTASSAFQVDHRGRGFAGQMDPIGTVLPYQRVLRGRSDLKLFDMATQEHLALPAGINTEKWEQWPARYGNQLTFIRYGRVNTTLFLVTDLTIGTKLPIKTIDSELAVFANVPKINGNWVTYAICNQRGCKIYRYDIGSSLNEKIPNPLDLLYFAPSPDLSGTVYFERSRPGCGRAARMMKWTGVGDPTIFYPFERGTDMTGSMTFDDNAGTITVFVDFFDCDSGKHDIYSFTDP